MPTETAILLVNYFDAYLECLKRHDLKRTQHVLIVVLCEKNLQFWAGDRLVGSCPVSHSKRPLSCQEGSLGTPWGLHEVAEKHGDGQPAGMVMVGRLPTGQCWSERSDTGPDQPSLVTTRILRLRGLESGLNAGPGIDSFDRYIYIHGTNFPERFPENVSAGCLLLRDQDLLPLYDSVPAGAHVYIVKGE
ncbi:MAG TPA: L,D-transpeptidase [Oceanipulchritudo sp.]|nr:L,D-transpeptidase [Oceanipulchritudo sp.]